MSMPSNILQVIVGLVARPSRLVYGERDSALGVGVCLGSIDVISLKMLGMDGAFGVWITLVLGETCAGKDCESNFHVFHVQQSLL